MAHKKIGNSMKLGALDPIPQRRTLESLLRYRALGLHVLLALVSIDNIGGYITVREGQNLIMVSLMTRSGYMYSISDGRVITSYAAAREVVKLRQFPPLGRETGETDESRCKW
ncbi:hypothetical protein E4U58_002464 [Claviceps cyperi]|nr:hypothetical protein E4U58_002464 [Claviceps cyperi]